MHKGLVAVTVAMLVSTTVPAAAADAAIASPLVLTVRHADGTPAADVVAVARVLDGVASVPASARPAYEFRADAGGAVTVTIPMSDPYISAHYPGDRVYGVHVSLYTFAGADRSTPTSFQAVDYVMNLGETSFPVDLAGVNGSVVDLVPVVVQTRPVVIAGVPRGTIPNSDGCRDLYPAQKPPVYACQVVTHPSEVQSEEVVIAHNVGAGAEMRTHLKIANTRMISTSVVSGVDGFFLEGHGGHQLTQTNDIAFSYTSSGVRSSSEDAVALTDFARVDLYTCWQPQPCTVETTFVPDVVRGGLSYLTPTSEAIYHDFARHPAPDNTDCVVGVYDEFHSSRGVNKLETWDFGFDFQGQYHAFTLHAQAVIDEATSEATVNSYAWYQAGSTLRYHVLFVPFGRQDQEFSDTAATCPDNSPGSTWTDASNVDKTRTWAQVVADPLFEPGTVADTYAYANSLASRCRSAPERCGGE